MSRLPPSPHEGSTKQQEPWYPPSIRVVLQSRVLFRVLLLRMPYYFGDLKRDPDLENHPHGLNKPN